MSDTNNEFADAIEAGSASGDAWDIKTQPTIVGTYKAKKSNVGPNNSNMYMLREDGKDEDTGVWGGTVLDGRFEEIPVGSRVKIDYLGVESSKRGNSFKNYKVLYIPNKDVATAADVMGPGTEVVS